MKIKDAISVFLVILLVGVIGSGCAYNGHKVHVINSKRNTQMDITINVPFKEKTFYNVLFGSSCKVYVYSIYNSRGSTDGSVVAIIKDMEGNVIGTYADTFRIYRYRDEIISIRGSHY